MKFSLENRNNMMDFFIKCVQYVLFFSLARVKGTSIKMDFLPSGHVRTDPIISQTCLSGHVHTFYGANVRPYPDLTYEELRAVPNNFNTGNVVENKSLYWHPTVYKYERSTEKYTRDTIGQTSAYYIWDSDQKTKAFPDGFRMIAGTNGNTNTEFPNALAECVEPSKCLRDDCYTENEFFPRTACKELEVSMFFPGCWDGVNLDSPDHMSHVAYTTDGDPAERCPATHPVRIPIIAFFFRIFNYDGGWHMFSDESGIYHADYVSGWDAKFLQKVLNRCKNDSLGPNPNAFCDDHITFRDGPKCSDDGCDFSDPNLLKKLKQIQPKLHNFRASISPENTASAQGNLPRGTCTGTLLPRAPTAAPQRNPTKAPTPNCKEGKKWKYLVKRKKNSKGKIKRWFKTCGWLRQRSEKYIKNQCKRTSPWDENFGPAKIECPKTCKTCHLVENRQKNEEEFTNYTSYSNAGL